MASERRTITRALFLTAALTLGGSLFNNGAEAREWKWVDVWPFPDCVYPCNPTQCLDPLCPCDCFQ
jgi:hypothetical protein